MGANEKWYNYTISCYVYVTVDHTPHSPTHAGSTDINV